MTTRRPTRLSLLMLATLSLLFTALLAPEADAQTTQRVELAPGWNLVSLHVLPADRSMAAVLASAGDAVQLVRDADGRQYDPASGIDELSPWEAERAYYVRATQAAALEVTGAPVDPSQPIELTEGWNPVPYLLADASPVSDALAPVLTDVHLVKDAAGNVYAPDHGIDAVEQMRPGQGYEVRMRRAATLAYAPAPEVAARKGFTYNPECTAHPGSVLVEEYGTLTPGAAADSTQRAANLSAINTAIAAAPVGGAVCLPADSLYITWDRIPPESKGFRVWFGSLIELSRDAITIMGAGACGWGDRPGCSYIGTPGDTLFYWDPQTDYFHRGYGIGLTAQAAAGDTLRGISLVGFELDGQVGWTGCYGYSYASPHSRRVHEDCWDTYHKGIHLGGGEPLDDVLIEDVKVHHFRGEIIFQGGFGSNDITVRRVKSYGSNGSSFNIATAKNLLVEDSYFGSENPVDPTSRVRFWAEFLAETVDGARTVFRNNTLRGCQTGDGCIALAFDGGHMAEQSWVFSNNDHGHINEGSLHFLLEMGGTNDVSVVNSTFEGGRWLQMNGKGSGSVTALSNVHTDGDQFVVFQGTRLGGRIADNISTGRSNAGRWTDHTGGSETGELVIENNTVKGYKSAFAGGLSASSILPLIRNNDFGDFKPYPSNLSTDGTWHVFNEWARAQDTGNTGGARRAYLPSYSADGQRVVLTNVDGDASDSITLPASHAQHGWNEDLELRKGDTLKLIFERESSVWRLANGGGG